MNFVSSKTPWLAKKAFPSYVWDIPTEEKIIYLTFDDGPTPIVTEKTLDILAEYNAKATFFCIGKNTAENPEVFQRIINEDHSIGNHTYNHLKGWKVASKDYIHNTLEAQKTIQQINKSTNQQKLFRPPYGKLTPSQGKELQKLGYKIIMWDVIAFDWDASISKETVAQNIISNTKKGSIVVLHDSIKASENMLYALPKALDYFSKKGFEFKSLR